ncbi:MAG: uroporphyrinogen-III C-methyltransferase [Syntrophaceae bacterium]|nr:uroporphyrinogen-III C-methyltransferase [Syntrophaceae bacterium]
MSVYQSILERENKPGTVYLVGSGPGDPGLITVKGLEKIREADAIIYDYLAGQEFVRQARPDAELIYVGKTGKEHTMEQGQINDLLIEKARQYNCVVRLKGGDPYVFGRGAEEAEELVEAGIPFEVIPGVTSAIAAPSYAGIPVTHRDYASMVTFITGHENPEKQQSSIDWANLANNKGSLVFLMGVKNLEVITSSLIENGMSPETPAALVRWGTTPDQSSFLSSLEKIAEESVARKFKAPAVLVVGAVASLKPKLDWYEKKSLFHKRVLITRSREQSKKMAERILSQGGKPILFPTIQIQPPDDFKQLDSAFESIRSYHWIIFTSVNAVQAFFGRFFELGYDIRDLAGPKFGAIGPVTASTIRAFGIKVEILAEQFVAEGVLEAFTHEDLRNKNILIPRAEKARDILPYGLKDMGANVNIVNVYRTGLPDDLDVDHIRQLLRNGEIDIVTFTSSSTVSHFVKVIGREEVQDMLKEVVLASIGPVTSQTIRDFGLVPTLEASEYTVDGLLAAIEAFITAGKRNS